MAGDATPVEKPHAWATRSSCCNDFSVGQRRRRREGGKEDGVGTETIFPPLGSFVAEEEEGGREGRRERGS